MKEVRESIALSNRSLERPVADRDAGPSHCSKGNPRLLRRSDGKVFILFSRDCLLVKASLWF